MKYTKKQIGWSNFFQSQLDETDFEQNYAARIIEILQNDFIVASEEFGKEVIAITGKMREEDASAVGDWLLLDLSEHKPVRRLERKNLFARRAAGSGNSVQKQMSGANLDILFIVTSANDDFNLSRLERYLTLAEQADVLPVVVLTKVDLCDDKYIFIDKVKDLSDDINIEAVDAHSQEDIQKLIKWTKEGQTIALMGSSGVGKSTIVNSIFAKEVKETAAVRQDDNKGRHTTTNRELIIDEKFGILLDSPGIRELHLMVDSDAISNVFSDIEEFSRQCKFRDCHHDSEPGCAVRQALEDGTIDIRRFNNYQKLLEEQKRVSESLAQKREKSRELTKHYKNVQKSSRKQKGDDY